MSAIAHSRRLGAAGLAALALSVGSLTVAKAAPSASADAPTPATPTPSTTQVPTTDASASAVNPASSSAAQPRASQAASSASTSPAATTAKTSITASISCTGVAPGGACVSSQTYAVKRGYITLTGTATGAPNTKLLVRYVNLSTHQTRVHSSVTADAQGNFQWRELASSVGTITYDVATADGAVVSAPMTITTVADPGSAPLTIALSRTATTVDSLKGGQASAALSTRQSGVPVQVYVNKGSGWQILARTTSSTNGAVNFGLTYDPGYLGTVDYQVRAGSVSSPSMHVTMVAYPDFTTGPVSRSLVYNTYHSGCPVTPAMLTKLGMTYYGFDGRAHTGYLVVRSAYVKNYEAAFSAGLSSRFPIRQMHDPSVYGNDEVSMAQDDTYAFYCRPVSGNPNRVSPHSYGTSVDVNTVENPYEEPGHIWKPANGASYVNRRNVRPGMFFASTPFTRAFLSNGFEWLGAAAEGAFDYQHFQIR